MSRAAWRHDGAATRAPAGSPERAKGVGSIACQVARYMTKVPAVVTSVASENPPSRSASRCSVRGMLSRSFPKPGL